jgi:hypothetical protein
MLIHELQDSFSFSYSRCYEAEFSASQVMFAVLNRVLKGRDKACLRLPQVEVTHVRVVRAVRQDPKLQKRPHFLLHITFFTKTLSLSVH